MGNKRKLRRSRVSTREIKKKEKERQRARDSGDEGSASEVRYKPRFVSHKNLSLDERINILSVCCVFFRKPSLIPIRRESMTPKQTPIEKRPKLNALNAWPVSLQNEVCRVCLAETRNTSVFVAVQPVQRQRFIRRSHRRDERDGRTKKNARESENAILTDARVDIIRVRVRDHG